MDEGIILDFEVDGRRYSVGRPPIRKQSTLAAGEPSMVWRIRNDQGHVIAKWPCSDPGLGAVIDERCAMIARRRLPDEKPEQVLAGRMLHIAVLQQAKLTALAAGVLNLPPYGVQLSRRAGWRKPPNTIVVSRPSRWGNPFAAGKTIQGFVVVNAEHAVRLFDAWLDSEVDEPFEERRQWMLANLDDLAGRNLACWCALDAPCHRNSLLRRANPTIAWAA